MRACVAFMQSLGAQHDHTVAHGRTLRQELAKIKGVRVYGSEPSTPTVGFTVDGMTAEAVTRRLAEKAVFVSHGDFYAATVIRELGVEALVRAGCACYTTGEEVGRLVDEVQSLAREL